MGYGVRAAAIAATAISDHESESDPHAVYQKESEKGAASGYSSLDVGSTVPDAEIPAAIARDAEVTADIATHAALATEHQDAPALIATHAAEADPHAVYQKESEKGAANGYASLDALGQVPDAQILATIARDAEITADIATHAALATVHQDAPALIATHAAEADPHAVYQKESEKGAASGYASLDAGTKIPDAEIPDGVARDSEVTADIATHAAAADPHAVYPLDGGRLIQKLGWRPVQTWASWAATVTGSGGTSQLDMAGWDVNTGATGTSTARLRSNPDAAYSYGVSFNVMDWDDKVIVQFRMASKSSTANGKSRLTLGKAAADAIGDLVGKGIGFRLDQMALKGICHDGTDAVVVDLSTTLTNQRPYDLVVTSDGAGNIEWFVNGVSKGTSSGGPTGSGVAAETLMQFEVDNGGDAAGQRFACMEFKVYVA